MFFYVSRLGCVADGPFGFLSGWRTQTGNCLMRILEGNTPDAVEVMNVQNITDFPFYEILLRVALHDTTHCLIGE